MGVWCDTMNTPLRIAFHGLNAQQFRSGFEELIGPGHSIVELSDNLNQPGEREHFENAEVIIGVRLTSDMPRPLKLKLYHAPAAGTDAIDVRLLPESASLCNCFGHEQAIAEYVMAALLSRHVPLAAADAHLRGGSWTYWAGTPGALRTELGAQTLGVLGLGHIGKTLAARGKAFGMRVHACNRTAIADPHVDQFWPLDELHAFMASADALVVTLPLTDNTRGLVDAQALGAMRPQAVLINVGRGPVVDEEALFDALRTRRIAAAFIDTWYQYPSAGQVTGAPSRYDFASLDNVIMTPHMSGWTHGTVSRRQLTLAENVRRLGNGQPLINQLLAPRV
jgi:phosphoglycerate dehydrogenase-like enzyme